MSWFSNLWHLAAIGLPFSRLYGQYHWGRMGQRTWRQMVDAVPVLDQIEAPVIKRARHYLLVYHITMQWFASLHGQQLRNVDLQSGRFVAVETPVADHLIDVLGLGRGAISGMLTNTAQDRWSLTMRSLHEQARAAHHDAESYASLLAKTLAAQDQSGAQHQGVLPIDTLKDITRDKGGYALLLYRSTLPQPISEAEYQAVFHLGGLMQLHNDIFDLYRDVQEGIQTLPQSFSGIESLQQYYRHEAGLVLQHFAQVDVTRRRLKRFLTWLDPIVQTGYICLHQYRRLEQRFGHFDAQQFSRADLVCDMQQTSNMAHLIHRLTTSDWARRGLGLRRM